MGKGRSRIRGQFKAARDEAEALSASNDPAITRAVEAWREVPEGLRSAAVHVLDTEPSKDSLTEEEMRTWKAAADLLRAAGGGT